MTENPLKSYYTNPGTYALLPSGGKYYSTPPQLSADGEIEVLPLTAIDELHLQSPDGLLNNDSLYKVLSRIVPGIANPAEVVKPDLDVIFIAMRIATYGEELGVDVRCPECGKDNHLAVNLPTVLATAKKMSNNDTIEIRGLKVKFRPYTIYSQNKFNEYMIDIQRTANLLERYNNDESISEDERERLREGIQTKVTQSSEELFEIVAKSIVSIETPEGETVTDEKFIHEWVTNIKAPEYEKIRDGISELSEEVIDRDFKYTCEKCEHQGTVEVEFDPANFFEAN